MNSAVLICLLAISSALFGQTVVPPGTILPVQLNSTLRSDKSKPGQRVSARIMQDVPLPNGSKIKTGAKVLGLVVGVQTANNRSSGNIVLRFDAVTAGSRRIPVTTELRAVASMMEVTDAELPQTATDRGTDEFDWSTIQIGGEANFHGSVITDGVHTVGKSIPPNGALVEMASCSGSKCRGSLEGNHQTQATWVFGSNACGVYGYPNVILKHAGRTAPIGEIVLNSNKGDLKLGAGSGMLLRVD